MSIELTDVPRGQRIQVRLIAKRDLSAYDCLVISAYLVKMQARLSARGLSGDFTAEDALNPREQVFRMPWMAREPALACLQEIKQQLPMVARIVAESIESQQPDQCWLTKPAQQLELFQGEYRSVKEFVIAKTPVSHGEFLRFVRETGYQTVAERYKCDETFRVNAVNAEVAEAERVFLPVIHICYHDAVAYCQWAHVRLPTEEEWVAAALLDPTWYETSKEMDRLIRKRLAAHPEALKVSDPEITATLVENGGVVVRQGPRVARSRSPKVIRTERFVYPLDYNLRLGFRVCKLAS